MRSVFSEDIFGYIFLFTDEFLPVTQDEKYFWLFDKLNYKTDPSHISENPNHQKLEWLFTDAIENYHIRDKYTDNICRNNLSSILLYCTRLYEDENPVLYKKGKGFELVNKFKTLVSIHFAENWSVKEYADQLAITPSHLNETIKKHTGNTASDFIDHKMILEIKRMLVHSDLNVTEIAEKFNFIDQSYFSKYFKKRSGTSPKDFKAKCFH
jgi:AraC family transcriptional activator of pobA